MKGWKEIPFGDLATFRNGLNFKNDSHGDGCYIIGIPDFQNHFRPEYSTLGQINPLGIVKDQDYLEKGDILFVRSNGNKDLVGRSLFIDKSIKAVFSGFCIRARIESEKAIPLFIAYFTRTSDFRSLISAGAGGANIQNLNQGILSRVKINLPPLPTQRKIAAILSAYDDLIENNLKRIKLLEEKAQLTYEEWFVRMKFPGYESMVFEEVNLNDLALYFGRGVTPQYEEGSGFWGINQKANKGSNLEKSHFKEYKKGDWVPSERFAKNGDVLLNSLGEGTIGRCHYYKWESDVYPVDQHMTIFRGKSPEISLFIYHLLASEQGQGILNSLKKGGTNMTMLNIGDLRTIKVNVPKAEILRDFYEKVEILFNQKSNLEYQNQLLKEARDILLPRLMTGMIDVDSLDLSAFEKGDQEEMLMAAESKGGYKKD
ncbi:type I restriction enzyme S subunit [Algoriphagus boseongensis]|uniref:Type I restriction enzyme S subunit n=1 Tax=Algoriphagus boseongensis TaxID=1442587 RepID=A0A4V3D2E6_9BACT|nr:restriction endonuclease subunit S [Algoriphagus boseongensis]TDQ18607.1 type I restriction enzyme S subunit [Algoriphagus boseongensis]